MGSRARRHKRSAGKMRAERRGRRTSLRLRIPVALNTTLRRMFRVIAATKVYPTVQPARGEPQPDAMANYACMPVRLSIGFTTVCCGLPGNRDTLESMSPKVQAERQAFLKQFDVPIRDATEFRANPAKLIAAERFIRVSDDQSRDGRFHCCTRGKPVSD